MGTIVINQTDCKQNVVLQSSADGITGGYYDAEGVWHEIGGQEPSGPKYSYTMDDLLVMHAAIAFSSSHNKLIVTTNDSTRRRAFMYTEGEQAAILATSTTGVIQDDSYLYPIPIPEDAKKVTISITPAERYVGPSFYTFNGSLYTRVFDPGWQEGSYELSLTPGAYDYMTVASKYDSAGNTYPDEPTGFSVVFEKE